MTCPLCRSKESKEIYRLCDNLKIMGESFPEDPAYLAACKNCGLVYMSTTATQEDYLAYYKYQAVAPKYYEMFGQEPSEEYYEHLLEELKPYLSEKSSILDVAGSWGEMAKYFYDAGYRDITVADPNEACMEAARQKGIDAVLCSSMDMGEVLREKEYDLVIMNHALEHVLDVPRTMQNIRAVLREEGLLFIEIPDASSYTEEEAAPFNFLTYEHVIHMTENDLRNLAAIYGFEVKYVRTYYKKVSNYPSLCCVMQKHDAGGKQPLYSPRGEAAMMQYIEKSRQAITAFLNPLRESGEPLVLWGIGASTTILLEAFSGCRVVMLVDKNPKRQGLVFTVNGNRLTITAPENVKDGTIVILSIPYHLSIEKQIREMGLKNKIVSLA